MRRILQAAAAADQTRYTGRTVHNVMNRSPYLETNYQTRSEDLKAYEPCLQRQ